MSSAIETLKKQTDMSNERAFIKSSFKIRTCVKYSGNSSDTCRCGRLKKTHQSYENGQSDWNYDENTCLTDCNVNGRIKFAACDDLCTDHKFIRFNVIDTSKQNEFMSQIVERAYKLIDVYWKVPTPKLIISIIGGFKRMDISTQQKKNFKQGLIDIMKKDKTVIVTGGFNVGVHKLVSETVREFRVYHENEDNRTHLIGISTWGVVSSNDYLTPDEDEKDIRFEFKYPNGVANEKSKNALDPNCDCFLFCDDGTEKKYDKEVDFRLKFEKYIETQAKAFAVQILFEGGYRAIYMAHKTLENKTSMVVLKGSGRAADVISEVMELHSINLEKKITTILKENMGTLNFKDNDLTKLSKCLEEMYTNHRKQIIIYDMYNSNMKFGQMIVEAIISGQTGGSLVDTLDLTIRFNCADIAKKEVFSSPGYSKIKPDDINRSFINVLKENKYEFVIAFIENDIEIDKVITEGVLISLYEESGKILKCPYAELIKDLMASRNIQSYDLKSMGRIISILSGNILEKFYSDKKRTSDSCKIYGAQDLFLWAIVSGRIELAEIFWRIGKDHVSSGLIGSTIFKNMAIYILKRGESELEKQLIEASTRFESLVFNVLTKAYSENKNKTFIILIRELKIWNNMTCFRIAISGNLLEFLSHSACRSYTTQVWMGGLSPFLSLWKILLTIPFSLCCIYYLIMPSFPQKKSIKKRTKTLTMNPSYENPEECILPQSNNENEEKSITYFKAMKIFYSAPIVKFYINFASYITFLFVFAYLNLVELKPRDKITGIRDMGAEIFVYAYLMTFISEEIRQIKDQERKGFVHKLQSYFSGSCNQLDAFIIFMFLISTIVRFSLLENHFMICRCMFSICYCMFCLRTMQFYFAYEFVGPKVIMIRNMIRDIVFFLSIFALFIVAFGTLSHSMRNPNSKLNIFLIKDILQMPYFQTYGELMLDKLFDEATCNSTNCHFQQTTVMIGFAVYLLLTNILLVNLLIAMFGYTFNQIQDQSGKYWLFIRLQLVEEFYFKPILSPPLNLLYYCYYLIRIPIMFCCGSRCSKPEDDDDKHDDDLLLKSLKGEDNLKITGFEQICMESSMEEMQSHLSDYVTKARTESQEKTEFVEKVPFQIENINQSEMSEFQSAKSYQIRCDKRLERLEKNLELIIAKEIV